MLHNCVFAKFREHKTSAVLTRIHCTCIYYRKIMSPCGDWVPEALKIHTALKRACVGRSSVELITRYYSNEKLAQCCFNVRPTCAMLADIKPTFGECAVLTGKALTVNMLEVDCFQTPMVT